KSLHKTDPYSFVAFGLPWINHEWLTELAFYGLWAVFSSSGLLVFKLLVGFAVAFLVMRTSGRERFVPLIRAGSVLLCLAAASRAFMVRPQLFSVLLFALFWFVLHGYLIKKENRLYLLPLLMALWVNFHGGFLMGLAVMGAVAAGESLEALWSPSSRSRAIRLWFWFLLCWGATLINPYGWGLHEWLSHSLSSPRQISEWMPISLSILDHWEIKLITALVLLAVMYKGKQNRPWEIAVMLLLLYAAWKHQRHSPFLGIVAAPFLASSLSALWNSKFEGRMRASITPRSRAWVAGIMLFVCLWFAGRGAVIYSATGMKIFVDPLRYPVYAANFLATNQIKGNLFTVFDWSQYA
ncbi:MAG: hypothetical protein QMD09_15590, partial [Desulfatibacillaceae bacterium]|nr:hypothetical protein [Desulfatibacillaceae bacterium]